MEPLQTARRAAWVFWLNSSSAGRCKRIHANENFLQKGKGDVYIVGNKLLCNSCALRAHQLKGKGRHTAITVLAFLQSHHIARKKVMLASKKAIRWRRAIL